METAFTRKIQKNPIVNSQTNSFFVYYKTGCGILLKNDFSMCISGLGGILSKDIFLHSQTPELYYIDWKLHKPDRCNALVSHLTKSQ